MRLLRIRSARIVVPRFTAVSLLLSVAAGILHAQTTERPEVAKAMELENAGKYKEAAALFRSAVRVAPTPASVLGLERAYSELSMTDSMVAPIDSVIAQFPREPIYRTVQLRTFQILRKEDRLRDAFERWVRAMPRDPGPYREYARILLQFGKASSADSIVQRGRIALGSIRDLEYENAQLLAAKGEWVPSAQSWRRALADAPHLASAAAYALAPVPPASRDFVRTELARPPAEPGPRRALADLELTWGRPLEAWDALRVLPSDSAAATMWEEFGERAFVEERWGLARDALVAALEVRRTPPLALRAATASLRAGTPADVFKLAPLPDAPVEQARAAREYLPLHVAALVVLGRAKDAEELIARYDRFLAPLQRMRLAQSVATAWVRAGDLAKAREALRIAGPDADSSEAAGWLALYEGHLDLARSLLKSSRDPSADLALAMGIIARVKGDAAVRLGSAFLALSRADSASASSKFVEAAVDHPEVAPTLMLVAARLRGGRTDEAIRIWERVIGEYPSTPEAAEAELEWARALKRRGDVNAAIAHLEHLILTAPQSALLPQARRELELARGTVPPG